MVANVSIDVSDQRLERELQTFALAAHQTPHRLFLDRIARENLAWVARRAQQTGLTPAYSVKTNPRREMLRYALENGFFAEVISEDEYDLACANGFSASDIIYNGPRPLERGRVGVGFADSVEAFERYCSERRSPVAGVRFRPGRISSRFGVPWDGLERCAKIAALSSARSVGLHFHVRPADFGDRSWDDIASEALRAALLLQERSGKPLSHFDVGGGWTPRALERALDGALPACALKARAELKHLEHIVMEPGQGVATPVEAIVTRVLEVRRRAGYFEAVLDTGYPDLPQMHSYLHRIFLVRDGAIERVPEGDDRVAGSTCLEYDILDNAIRVEGLITRGDVLVITDAGAYDASMSFAFAHGERRPAV